MLQIHPSALAHGGAPLLALCIEAARGAGVPCAVHLDHSPSPDAIRAALDTGVASVMADGSHLPYEENLAFTAAMAGLAHARGAAVEAELGRLAGTEDGLTVPEYEAKLTDPDQAADFVARTGVDTLAVCIGNVHGHYRGTPQLDFARLERLRWRVPIPLVLHGASGLAASMVRRAIELGVCKLNVNTELRDAYLSALTDGVTAGERPDLLDLMQAATDAMQVVVAAKLRLFGSAGKA
jgi:tagatose 1,6-diphosphate aldolase GatY/KbaY